MKVDYIIVGFGLAGLAFAERLVENGKTFVVFDNNSQRSSRVAGGLFNPVILKRFTMAWRADEQMKIALPMYERLENRFHTKFKYQLPVLRRFNSVEEQNTWAEASDKPILEEYLDVKFKNKEEYISVNAPQHFGMVQNTGRIRISNLLDSFIKDLDAKNAFRRESFEHDLVINSDETVTYKDIQAKHIVFSEGYGLKLNPYFNDLPMTGNKGEYIIIKSPELNLKEAIKSSLFIIPLGEDVYKVGATYNHDDKTLKTTEEAKKELVNGLQKIVTVPFEVVDQMAGVRPTVLDRRPLVGTHKEFNRLHVLNGLGTRGILIGPAVAKSLYEHLENNVPLDKEINIQRFEGREL